MTDQVQALKAARREVVVTKVRGRTKADLVEDVLVSIQPVVIVRVAVVLAQVGVVQVDHVQVAPKNK
jgi:hypothetical protein